MRKKNLVYGILLVALLALLLYRYGYFTPGNTKNYPGKEHTKKEQDHPKRTDNREPKGPHDDSERRRESFDRNTDRITYTRHARCRMGCRHIDENEVKEILQKGDINYSKSDMRAHPDPKYALEGMTSDGQHVRIIFAPSPRGMVVITVIDLNKEWTCHCD